MTQTSNRIYTETEFFTERPKGDLLIRAGSDGKVYSVFQCYGCQTCFEYICGDTGNVEDDRVEQIYPHFYRFEEVNESPTIPNP